MKPKLKIGLLVNSFNLPLWEYELINTLVSSYYAEIVLVVKKKVDKTRNNGFNKIRLYSKDFVYALFLRIDKILYKTKLDAFTPDQQFIFLEHLHLHPKIYPYF